MPLVSAAWVTVWRSVEETWVWSPRISHGSKIRPVPGKNCRALTAATPAFVYASSSSSGCGPRTPLLTVKGSLVASQSIQLPSVSSSASKYNPGGPPLGGPPVSTYHAITDPGSVPAGNTGVGVGVSSPPGYARPPPCAPAAFQNRNSAFPIEGAAVTGYGPSVSVGPSGPKTHAVPAA